MKNLTPTEHRRLDQLSRGATELRHGFSLSIFDQHLLERKLIEISKTHGRVTIRLTDKARKLLAPSE